MNDDTTLGSRVHVLENSVEKLENRVEAGFSDISKMLRGLGDQISQKGHPLPFKEIAATVVACLAIFAYVGNYLEGQYKKNVSVLEYRIEQLEKKAVSVPQLLVK